MSKEAVQASSNQLGKVSGMLPLNPLQEAFDRLSPGINPGRQSSLSLLDFKYHARKRRVAGAWKNIAILIG